MNAVTYLPYRFKVCKTACILTRQASNAPINVKPAEGRRGIGRDFDDRFGPGVGHLNFLAVPGVGISEFLFVPVTTNHFLGWEI